MDVVMLRVGTVPKPQEGFDGVPVTGTVREVRVIRMPGNRQCLFGLGPGAGLS